MEAWKCDSQARAHKTPDYALYTTAGVQKDSIHKLINRAQCNGGDAGTYARAEAE